MVDIMTSLNVLKQVRCLLVPKMPQKFFRQSSHGRLVIPLWLTHTHTQHTHTVESSPSFVWLSFVREFVIHSARVT